MNIKTIVNISADASSEEGYDSHDISYEEEQAIKTEKDPTCSYDSETQRAGKSSSSESPTQNKLLNEFMHNLNAALELHAGSSEFSMPCENLLEFNCTNIQYGCQFSTLDERSIDRHENWLCAVGNACLICFEDYCSNGRIFHLENNHTDCTRYAIKNGQIAKIICKNTLPMTNCQLAIKDCHGKTFIAIFEFGQNNNFLFITTNPDPENRLFTFKFRICDKTNSISVSDDLIRIKNDDEEMYWLTVLPVFGENANSTFDFVMTVKKWPVNEFL